MALMRASRRKIQWNSIVTVQMYRNAKYTRHLMSVRKILINYKEKVCRGKIVKEKEKDNYVRRCRGNMVNEKKVDIKHWL
jgi:hypothetical protein